MKGVWKIAGVIGIAAGILSLAMLVKEGFDVGFAAPLQTMLDYYERTMGTLFGWAEPPLKSLLDLLRAWTSFDLHLYPHWKHVFVLMWLYFSLDARISVQHHKPVNAWISVTLGFLLAVLGGISYGNVESTGSTLDWFAIGVPIGGFVLHAAIIVCTTTFLYPALAQPWQKTFQYYLRSEVLSAMIVALLAVVAGIFAVSHALPNPNLLTLGAFVILRGIYWLFRGATLAVSNRAQGETHLHRFNRAASARFGILFFTVLLGAALFIALNAGLS